MSLELLLLTAAWSTKDYSLRKKGYNQSMRVVSSRVGVSYYCKYCYISKHNCKYKYFPL